MNAIRRYFFVLLFLFQCVDAKEYIIMRTVSGQGMFSQAKWVLSLTKGWEMGNYNGIEVDFGDEGVYYDPTIGPNWWNYYFEPIEYGVKENVRYVWGDSPMRPHADIQEHSSREEVYALIQKHMRILPHIQEKIEAFDREHFANRHVVGVHYRGTDKNAERGFVHYDKVIEMVKRVMSKNSSLFVATDEQQFLDKMVKTFGSKVCYYDAYRSSTKAPVHLSEGYNHYKAGEDALIDAVLLSRCDFLVRTDSNVSLFATYFNPQLPVIMFKGH